MRQPQGVFALRPDIAGAAAFVWAPWVNPFTLFVGPTLTKTGTPARAITSAGVGLSFATNDYLLGPASTPLLKTNNGSGTGDFSLMIVDNAAGADPAVAGRSLLYIRSDTGAPYVGVGINANKNSAGTYVAGSLAAWIYNSGYQAIVKAGAVDGAAHCRLLTRVGTTLYLYQDGVLLGTSSASSQSVIAADSRLGIGVAYPTYNASGPFSGMLALGLNVGFKDVAAVDVSSNPWQLFAEPQWLYTGMGSGSWTPLEVTG